MVLSVFRGHYRKITWIFLFKIVSFLFYFFVDYLRKFNMSPDMYLFLILEWHSHFLIDFSTGPVKLVVSTKMNLFSLASSELTDVPKKVLSVTVNLMLHLYQVKWFFQKFFLFWITKVSLLELLLFENYSHSLSTLSSKNNRSISETVKKLSASLLMRLYD